MATDALQADSITWRGLIAWDKIPAARSPHMGYFRHQCEYVVLGYTRQMPQGPSRGPWPGCYRAAIKQADKHHLTGKPTDLMRQLIQYVPPNGVILAPFMGSGTTGVAALHEGRHFIGIEQDPGVPHGDQEAFRLAQQLCSVIRRAGWGCEGVNQNIYQGPVLGLVLPSPTDPPPAEIGKFYSALKSAGLTVTGELNPKGISQSKLRLVVGSRP